MKNNPFKTSEEFLYGQNGGAGRVIDVEAARQEAELPDLSGDMGEEERQRKIEAVRTRRLNLARAAARMVFSKDIDLMDDESRAGLYRASTKALFGFEDTDGRVAFGKKAGDMKSNLERLRLFLKGDVSQIEDEDVAAWRKLHGADEETRFRHADAHLKGKGSRDWDNGPSSVELAGAGMPGAQFGNFMQNAAAPTKDAATRKMRYETMNDEEKAAFRADTIARYERQIASANPLSMFLKTSAGISDEAAWILAKCFQNGNVDVKDIEAIGDGKEREKVLTALSMMRGDKKSGRLLGFIPQDFEDGTDFGNRLQMNIYGIQQAFAGLVTDVWDLGKAGIDELKIYAKGLKDTEEAREMRRRTDLEAQIAAALRQKLPDADSFMGALSQGVAENVHWIAPYVGPFRVINKGKAAVKGVKALKGALAMDEIGAAAKGVKAAVKGVAVAKSEAGLARQMAALELYTERLRELSATADAALKAMPEATQALAKTGVAAKGRAMIAAGRTAAFSSFANDYIETADAEGISRAESVPSAVFVGVINQAIERFNVPGLDRTITPAELKSLALRSAVEAFRHERSAGLRKWVADSVAIRAREMGRTVATEALTEEPLQQFTTQMALEVDKTIDELKKEGKADLANVFGELWGKIGADGFGKAWRLYFDTVQESLPAAVGFGVTGVAMQRGGQMWRNSQERKISGDMSYDEGIVDVLQRERNVRKMMAVHWMKDGGKMEEARNAVNEMFSSARAAYSKRKAGDDTVRLVANAAGVDRKTAEVLHDCLEIEESMALYSPRFRAEVNLADAVMDIDEKKLKAVLPEYVEGSFLADKEKGLYSARLNLPNGEEKTLVYRVGDMSQWIDEQIGEGGLADGGELADSYEARRREMPEGAMKPWSELSDAERRDIALQGTDGFLSGRAGVFEFGGADGQKVTVRADDVISLASGRIADVGYVGAQATGRTLRHETFHALWRFAKGTLSKEDIEALYSHFPDLDPAAASDRKLDERMAVEFERYASGNFVPMKVRGTLDRFAGWAMDKLGKLLDAVGVRRDGVADPVTGKAYTLSDFYDKVLKGELGSGELGVEKRLIAKDGASGSLEPQPKDASSMNAPPGEVTEEELAAVRAREEAETRKAATETEKSVLETEQPVSGTEKPVSGTSEGEIVYTAENPADASVPNARYYKIGLPNSEVKLVGRLEVRDAHAGLTTSTDEDYHDRGNQNRDDKSEESRALVMKIAGHPDPLQIGTVQPIANNGIVWILNNSNVIIGNHRVNGVRAGYEKGTADDLEKFVREDAAKRGIEIGEGVNAPLTVFVLERIESPDGKADVHEVVRLANESQNRGFNIREQAGNDAKILIDNNLLPRMAFRADGRLDETKCADAIGKFRQESGAQGLVGEDGMLTEEGSTRIQNAAVAALLGGTGNNALLGRIMDNAGRLDMASQLRALMKVTPELMSLAKTKPQFDIRDALAEALTLYTEWREKDEEKRSEKGKNRHDWRELDKEGKRKRGLSWEAFMSQGDMFRTPSEEAKILGDLFARTEQLRSFDREDVESTAGKKRVVDLITDYLTDYIENARNVNTETEDMFGGTPASRAEVLAAQRAKGEGGARFSINPNLRAELENAVGRNPQGKYISSGGRGIRFADSFKIMEFLGVRMDGVFTTADRVRKMVAKHNLSTAMIADIPVLCDDPAAVFCDIDDKGSIVILTDAQASYEKNSETKPVMVLLRPEKGGNGGFVASAYSRAPLNETAYSSWKEKLRYVNKNKIAGINLEGETVSQLEPQASGDTVLTAEDYSSWSAAHIVSQNGDEAQARFSIASPAEDVAYLDAVNRGDMETAQKLLKVVWERNGYSQLRDHLDAHAAPSAPVEAEDFKNVEALMEAREEGWDLNLWAVAKGISGQPNDFFSEQGPRLYGYDDKAGIETQKEIAKAISMIQAGINTRIYVYRAVPNAVKSDFLQSGGEWVSPSKTYVENHGKFRFGEGEYRIIERLVPAEHLWWDGNDAREWGYDDGRQYVYANTENGSKLATVTYDSDGNVIPLSQRFNPQNNDIRFSIKLNALPLDEAKERISAQKNILFRNFFTDLEVTLSSSAEGKLVSKKAAMKSVENGFTFEQHNAMAASVGELFERGFEAVRRGDRKGDANIKTIRRYVCPVAFDEKKAFAWITVKESKQHGAKIYSVESIELEAFSRKVEEELLLAPHALNAPTAHIVSQDGDEAQTRFSIGGVYTGSAADYEKPSLHYVGKSNGVAFGWGLYGSSAKSDAVNFGDNIYEQTFFTNRPEGDESHLIEWDKPLSEENKNRILDGLVYQARKNEAVKNAVESTLADEARDFGLDQDEDYVPESVEGMADDVLREAIERTIDVQTDNGRSVYTHLAALLTGKSIGEVNSFAGRLDAFKAASEFLRDECDIDGIKYPAEADGAKHGETHYVSFRDDNIRVDHKWVDGEQRFSIATLGKYRTDDLRSLAHRVKDGDAEAIAEAGRRLAVILPPDAVLVPMPSHTGEPTTMRLLADAIAANANGAKVVDALRSNAHESNYAQKKRGEEPAEIEMRKVADIPENAEVYIVDNVIDTGATYSAAMKAIPNAHILALADTDRTPEELRRTFSQNIDYILSRFDEAKGLSKEEIFKKFDNENVEIGWIPTDVPLPIELSVAKRSVKASEAYVLDHLHNTPHHERQLTADDALRMFTLINSQNEMRIVPQRGSLSIAFIAKNPVDGWDCVVIAPKRGEFYLFKTMFAQKRKPYQGKTMIRNSESVRRGEAADLLIRGGLSSIRDFSETQQIISNSLSENNRPSAELLEAMGRKAAEEKKNAGKGGKFQPARRASMAFAYPNLAWMSNEELLSAAVAAKMALGKSDKVSDRNTTINEVQRKVQAIHPDWDSTKVSVEAQRILGDARKLSKEIRGDIDKGVSDSLILEHLPKSMRTVFGEEMTGEARRGWRLGLFQAKAEAGVQRKVAEAQERLMRDALEIETGMMHGDIERGFGVDLAATLLKVKENEYLKVVPKSSGGEAGAASGEVETMGESVAEDAFSADETVEEIKPKVSALVQAIAKRAEAKAEEESAKRKANRERAEKRVGNEDINDGKDAEPDTGDFAGGEISPEEVVEEAVKAGADLNNPLSFALFVMEMARESWVKKHNLNPEAEPKHSLVYIQFQRKTLQDVYSTLARRVTYSRGRETVMNALQRLDKVTTMRGLIREAEFMGKLVGAKMIRESAQAMCERLDNLLKTEFQTGRQFKPDEESLNRKVPAMLERQARYMRHAMWLTPDGVSEETRALLQEKALAGSEFDEHGADKSVSRVIDEADMKLKILADWGALKYKDLATVEAAVQWWLNAAEGGADAIAQAWDVREARTLKAAGVLAKAVRNPKRKTAVDGRSWTQTANEIFQGHMLFHHLLEDLTRFAGEEERAAAKRYIDWLDLEIQKAGTRVASERIKMQDEMRKAVEQIYGRKFRDVVSELSALDGRFDAFMGAADDGVSVPGTKGRAMQLLVSLQQIGYAVEVEDEENPGQMKTVYMGGYYDNIVENGRVGQAEELLKLMSPADLNFIKWLRQWYERNRKGISDVSERIFGVGVMAELGNYMPVKMLLDPKGLENGAGATWQIFPKALTPRVRNKRDFDTSVDILTMWSGRLEESIQWKHHVELGIELRGIFGRSELQKAIRANHGAKVLSLVKGFITDILNGKGEKQEMMVNPMLDRARQFAALGGLGGNVGVMLKQTTGIPSFGFEIGVWRTFGHLVGTLTPQGWADVRKVAQSEEFRNRWQDGYSEEVQNALSSENPGLLMRLWMKSMVTNKAGDCVPALLIGHGIYRDGIEQGMSERDAMARTWMIVERTQQSSRIENRTAFQRRNALGNAIYQFLSTQNQMLNYEVRALRDAVADPKNPKKWGKFVRDATLVHFVLSTFYYWMGELYKKLLGQEPSEDQLKDWVVSIIVGPVGALYGVGTTTVDAVESWVKGYSYGSSNAVPALNWLGQVVVRDPTILIHDIFNGKKSWDDVCDDMLRWLSDFNATFRDARKFYRFRIKEEKQKKRK